MKKGKCDTVQALNQRKARVARAVGLPLAAGLAELEGWDWRGKVHLREREKDMPMIKIKFRLLSHLSLKEHQGKK